MRATMSVGPPAANGTMTVIGLLGYEDCADSSLANTTSNTPSAMFRSTCAIKGTSSFACLAATRRSARRSSWLMAVYPPELHLWLVPMPPAWPWLPALSIASIYRASMMVAKIGASSERVSHFDVRLAPCWVLQRQRACLAGDMCGYHA